MFDKRNMTITRRAAASSGPCLADRVWLTLWPASSHAQSSDAGLGPGHASLARPWPPPVWPGWAPTRDAAWHGEHQTRPCQPAPPALNHCLQLVVSIVWLVKTNWKNTFILQRMQPFTSHNMKNDMNCLSNRYKNIPWEQNSFSISQSW